MVENWRSMPLHTFGFQVQCGGCEEWVTSVWAKDVADAQGGRGRCRDCVLKAPFVVEVPAPAAPEEPVESGAPEAEADVAVEADPESPIPGTVEATEDLGEPEVAPLEDEGAPPEETPRKRR